MIRQPRRSWTTGELARAARLYRTHTAQQVARATGRTVYAIQCKALEMGWRKSYKWDDPRLAAVLNRPEGVTIKQVACELGWSYGSACRYVRRHAS